MAIALHNHQNCGALAEHNESALCHCTAYTWPFAPTDVQGAKKTKLGLREFVSLGDFEQRINIEEQHAVSDSACIVYSCAATWMWGSNLKAT